MMINMQYDSRIFKKTKQTKNKATKHTVDFYYLEQI